MTPTPLPEQSMNPIKSEDELKTGYLKVQLDYAPIDDEEKFKLWCKKYNFDYVGLEGRGAWCSSLGTYFRGASGVAFNDGEMFLFYEDNLIDITDLQRQHEREVVEAIKDPFDYIEPCEPDCSAERHAYHQGQWDMAHRMADKGLTNNQEGEK